MRRILSIYLCFFWVFLFMDSLFANIPFPSLSEIKQAINDTPKKNDPFQDSFKEFTREKYQFIIRFPEEWPHEVKISALKPAGKIEAKIESPGFHDSRDISPYPPQYNNLYSMTGHQWEDKEKGYRGIQWETASIIVPVKYSYAISDTDMIMRKGKLEVKITFYRPAGSDKLLKQIIQNGDGANPENFSIEYHVPSSKPHIFSKAEMPSGHDAQALLKKHFADIKPAKAVWLLRESKSLPGALTVSYNDRQYRHRLYVLTRDNHRWIFVGADEIPDDSFFIPVGKNSEKVNEYLVDLYRQLELDGFKKEGQIVH